MLILIRSRLFLADGAVLPYDSLIVAAGSQTSYFGHDEWRDWAAGMKSIEEATIVRHNILYAFEVAERISDPEQRRAWLTFVIVRRRANWSRTGWGHCGNRAEDTEE